MENKASNFEFSNHRLSLSGTLTSSDSWQMETGYHYMLCRYVGVGGAVGLWKVQFEEGRAHGDGWEVRSLAYKGVSFKRFYPQKPFMQGAYLALSCYF